MSAQKVALVDAIADGYDLALEFTKRGIQCCHIWSSSDMYKKKFHLFNPVLYEQCLIHENIDKTMKWLSEEGHFLAVIPVRDSCVGLADELNAKLSLDLNPLENSNLRQDRYNLAVSLGEPAEIDRVKILHNVELIKKPRQSMAGYDRVEIFRGQEIEPGFFVQPYYPGQEFGVDTVSYMSNHRIVGIYKYAQRLGKGLMHDEAISIDPKENIELYQSIKKYVNHVLNFSGYRFGPAHIEIKEHEKSFRLIEANFRIQHGMDFKSTALAYGKNQIQLTVDAYLNKWETIKDLDFVVNNYLYQVHFINTISGKRACDVNWSELTAIKGVTKVYRPYINQSILPVNTFTVAGCAAIIMVAAETKHELQDSIARVRNFIDRENQN